MILFYVADNKLQNKTFKSGWFHRKPHKLEADRSCMDKSNNIWQKCQAGTGKYSSELLSDSLISGEY
jgi:hypothetical protein